MVLCLLPSHSHSTIRIETVVLKPQVNTDHLLRTRNKNNWRLQSGSDTNQDAGNMINIYLWLQKNHLEFDGATRIVMEGEKRTKTISLGRLGCDASLVRKQALGGIK
ncbi:hypothetical protein SLA2020_232480 [Shorea laevis]